MQAINIKELEKSIKKNARILAVLIILVILLGIYSIILAGDISSVDAIVQRKYYAEDMVAAEEGIVDLEEGITKAEGSVAKYAEEIAGYDEQIAALEADIEAINNGTYVAE